MRTIVFPHPLSLRPHRRLSTCLNVSLNAPVDDKLQNLAIYIHADRLLFATVHARVVRWAEKCLDQGIQCRLVVSAMVVPEPQIRMPSLEIRTSGASLLDDEDVDLLREDVAVPVLLPLPLKRVLVVNDSDIASEVDWFERLQLGK